MSDAGGEKERRENTKEGRQPLYLPRRASREKNQKRGKIKKKGKKRRRV